MGEGAHLLHSVLSGLLPGSVQLQGNCEPVSESPEENRQNQRLEKFTYEERWTLSWRKNVDLFSSILQLCEEEEGKKSGL